MFVFSLFLIIGCSIGFPGHTVTTVPMLVANGTREPVWSERVWAGEFSECVLIAGIICVFLVFGTQTPTQVTDRPGVLLLKEPQHSAFKTH